MLQLWPLSWVVFLPASEESYTLLSLHSIKQLQRSLSSPPIFLFPEAQQLQLLLPGLKYHCVFKLGDLSWTLLCSCLSRTAKFSSRPSTPDVSPEQRGRIISLNLLMHFLMCSIRLLAFFAKKAYFWLMVNWHPSSFSARLLVSPQHVLVLGVTLP